MVNYEGGRGRVEVQRHTNGWGSTLLVIRYWDFTTFQKSSDWEWSQVRAAGARDGGNFTCAPHRSQKNSDLKKCDKWIFSITPASVLVTIMDSEGKSAAVHEDETNFSKNSQNFYQILILLPLSYCLLIYCWIKSPISMHFGSESYWCARSCGKSWYAMNHLCENL